MFLSLFFFLSLQVIFFSSFHSFLRKKTKLKYSNTMYSIRSYCCSCFPATLNRKKERTNDKEKKEEGRKKERKNDREIKEEGIKERN
jgi:hypothetical protein